MFTGEFLVECDYCKETLVPMTKVVEDLFCKHCQKSFKVAEGFKTYFIGNFKNGD